MYLSEQFICSSPIAVFPCHAVKLFSLPIPCFLTQSPFHVTQFFNFSLLLLFSYKSSNQITLSQSISYDLSIHLTPYASHRASHYLSQVIPSRYFHFHATSHSVPSPSHSISFYSLLTHVVPSFLTYSYPFHYSTVAFRHFNWLLKYSLSVSQH